MMFYVAKGSAVDVRCGSCRLGRGLRSARDSIERRLGNLGVRELDRVGGASLFVGCGSENPPIQIEPHCTHQPQGRCAGRSTIFGDGIIAKFTSMTTFEAFREVGT